MWCWPDRDWGEGAGVRGVGLCEVSEAKGARHVSRILLARGFLVGGFVRGMNGQVVADRW